MDLKEYLFYEKNKNKEFSHKFFAKKLGLSHTYLSNIITGKYPPSAHVLYLIDKHTGGKVDVLQMLRKAYEVKDRGCA
jgi:transcriptional regulator with XRE-family HTH domain